MKKLMILMLPTLLLLSSCNNNGGDILDGPKPSLEGAMTLSGIVNDEPGASAGNSVYVDFSTDTQTPIARTSWNLGFSCGSSFAVKLNETTASMAVAADVAMTDVLSTAELESYMTTLTMDFTDKLAYLDDLSGDLTKTVIRPNNVYIVNLGEGQEPLYKVQVTEKDASTYRLSYAKGNETTVTTLEIAKQTAYNFVYVSFVQGTTVSVEPEKAAWDIRWSKSISSTSDGSTLIPYFMADFVTFNYLNGVEVALVNAATTAYDAFTVDNIAALDFSSDVNFIGASWRSVMGENAGVFNQYYIVKDPAGNYYKLQFLTMGVNSDGGTRGKPELRYALLQ